MGLLGPSLDRTPEFFCKTFDEVEQASAPHVARGATLGFLVALVDYIELQLILLASQSGVVQLIVRIIDGDVFIEEVANP